MLVSVPATGEGSREFPAEVVPDVLDESVGEDPSEPPLVDESRVGKGRVTVGWGAAVGRLLGLGRFVGGRRFGLVFVRAPVALSRFFDRLE